MSHSITSRETDIRYLERSSTNCGADVFHIVYGYAALS